MMDGAPMDHGLALVRHALSATRASGLGWVSACARSIEKFEENKKTALIKGAGHPRLL